MLAFRFLPGVFAFLPAALFSFPLGLGTVTGDGSGDGDASNSFSLVSISSLVPVKRYIT